MHGRADLTRPRHVRAVALATLLLLGLAVPSFAHASTTSNTTYALGSYNNARGDRAYTVCSFSVSQQTTVQNGYDDIAMMGAVGCITSNVGIFGSSTLYDNAGGSIINRDPLRPVLANGTNFSPNISPNSQTYASYREYSPSRVKYYQARAELDLSSSGGGWQILDPQCTGSYTPRIACNLGITFPGEYEDLQDGRSKTMAQIQAIQQYAEELGGQARDQILAALEQAQRDAQEILSKASDEQDTSAGNYGADADAVDEPDDEAGAVLVPETVPDTVTTSVDVAAGSRWHIRVPGHDADAATQFVTMRRSPSSFVIGHAIHNQYFTKSATRGPAHYGRVGGGYNYCGWLRGGTVGGGAIAPASPSCSTDPASRFEVREFASLVNCDPRRNRAGGPHDCVQGAVVRLQCGSGSNRRFQNVRPWTATTPADELPAIDDQEVRWRYVTKDGAYVNIQLVVLW